MTITITNTPKVVELDGVHCTLWEGKSDTGLDVHCFVALIAVEGNNTDQLKQELRQYKLPSKNTEAYGLKLLNHKSY